LLQQKKRMMILVVELSLSLVKLHQRLLSALLAPIYSPTIIVTTPIIIIIIITNFIIIIIFPNQIQHPYNHRLHRRL